ncbi:MAG TPA: RDD family protein [Burkholderiales bacterium]
MTDDATPSAPQYVGFWKRLFAFFIDSFVLIAVIIPLLLAVYGSQYFARTEPGFVGVWDVLIQVVLPIIAVIVFWRYRGATPGKMLLSAKIVDAETLGAPSTGKLVGRYFAYFLSCIFMLGFIWIAFDKRKQGWHDKLAGTVVIHDEDE